jgi:hypothetical protein
MPFLPHAPADPRPNWQGDGHRGVSGRHDRDGSGPAPGRPGRGFGRPTADSERPRGFLFLSFVFRVRLRRGLSAGEGASVGQSAPDRQDLLHFSHLPLGASSDHRFLAMRHQGRNGRPPARGERRQAILRRSGRSRSGGRRFAAAKEVEISIDSSGTPLHERGYRTESGDAPLRETVAAMIILTALRREHEVILDPFCGSGTLAIEAAMIVAEKPPGSLGRHYAWERWDWLQSALSQDRPGPTAAAGPTRIPRRAPGSGSPAGVGPELPRSSPPTATRRWSRLPDGTPPEPEVSDLIEFHVSDVRDSLAAVARRRTGLLVTNPPYGRRLNPPELERLYGEFGLGMKRAIGGWDAWIILGEGAPYQSLGLAPDRKVQVFNGGMPAQLCHYQLRTPDPRRAGGRPR